MIQGDVWLIEIKDRESAGYKDFVDNLHYGSKSRYAAKGVSKRRGLSA